VRTVLTNCFFCFGRVNLVPEVYSYHRYGVRLVTPFASSDLLGVTGAMKRAGQTTSDKSLIRKLAGRSLPRAIADRPSMGFSSPMAKWLRGSWEPVCRAVLQDPQETLPPWAATFGLRLLDEHLASDDPKGESWPLFALMVWIAWHFFQRAGCHHPAICGEAERT